MPPSAAPPPRRTAGPLPPLPASVPSPVRRTASSTRPPWRRCGVVRRVGVEADSEVLHSLLHPTPQPQPVAVVFEDALPRIPSERNVVYPTLKLNTQSARHVRHLIANEARWSTLRPRPPPDLPPGHLRTGDFPLAAERRQI